MPINTHLRRRSIAFISATFAMLFFNLAMASTTEPLPSWQDGKSKQAIIDFVTRVTNKDSADFVEVNERIVTFDNDGTLWAEQPIYAQLLFAIERIHSLASQHPEWQTKPPFSLILKGDVKAAFSSSASAVNDIVMAANTGMSDLEYQTIVAAWIATAKHPVTQKPITSMVYQPMLELLEYFRANEFKTYIVSGGGIEFIRAWSSQVYGIPPEQVIGSVMAQELATESNKTIIKRLPTMAFYNNKENKVIAINNHIGRRPLAAFGNSDGDLPMLKYVSEGDGLRLAMLIHHTDENREWAYDAKSQIGQLDKGLQQAQSQGWLIVDMKQDWNRIYPGQ
ncbi:HAD family hydrolase [Thalassotalea sp. Y01]|uniref:HAD family hydrolase n=1 Tax=Thalassotalea sp. Y01 TaxID=2729613 RepID=UPI00145DCA0B|nr:HAD family hydrolase [Thalassotalea sp. Y01]NMP15486.1 haloacid dehalogenase-like hydrolase [Thalassotalea sp. Y01]